jgi:hypothetical protein
MASVKTVVLFIRFVDTYFQPSSEKKMNSTFKILFCNETMTKHMSQFPEYLIEIFIVSTKNFIKQKKNKKIVPKDDQFI